MGNWMSVRWVRTLLALACANCGQVVAQTQLETSTYRTGNAYRVGSTEDRYAFATLAYTDAKVYHRGDDQSPARQRLNRFGFHLQMPQNRGSLEYGVEVGFNLSFDSSPRNHTAVVRLAGEESSIRIRSEIWLADVALGGFVSVRPSSSFRLYASAGPALYWGQQGANRNSHSDFGSSPSGSNVTIGYDRRSSRHDWQLGPYVQAGAEWVASRRTTFGLNVRYTDATLHFGERSRIDLSSPVYALTLGYHF